MQNNYDLLKQAILQRRLVTAFYEDHERHFCPHVLGTKRGEAHVLGFQYAGGSSTLLPAGGDWRCMRVQGLTEILLHDGPWRTRSDYSSDQVCVDEIDVKIPF